MVMMISKRHPGIPGKQIRRHGNEKAGLIVCGFAMLATLTGCKDAVADISNGSEKLVSVGDTTITKDKLYNLLKGSNGGSATIELVQNKIYEKEGIKLSEDMKKRPKRHWHPRKNVWRRRSLSKCY